jgi:hypothetical protein
VALFLAPLQNRGFACVRSTEAPRPTIDLWKVLA